MAFSFWLAWKVTTRRALIGISSPVLGLRPGPLRLVAQLEVAEAGELHALAALEGAADLLEKGLDHVFGLALVQPDLLEQQVGQLGLRQSHHSSLIPFYVRRRCGRIRGPAGRPAASRAASASASVRVRSVSCITTRNARLFVPAGGSGPGKGRTALTARTMGGFPASIASRSACAGSPASTGQRDVPDHRREPRGRPRAGQRQALRAPRRRPRTAPAAAAARTSAASADAARRASRRRAPSTRIAGRAARMQRRMRRGLEAQFERRRRALPHRP